MRGSSLRFGSGVTAEVGYDVQNAGARKTLIVTDSRVKDLRPFMTAADSLTKLRVPFDVFDGVQVEPTDLSFMKAAEFAKKGGYDCFVAVGGGSSMDTAKAAALCAANKGTVKPSV